MNWTMPSLKKTEGDAGSCCDSSKTSSCFRLRQPRHRLSVNGYGNPRMSPWTMDRDPSDCVSPIRPNRGAVSRV